MITEEDIKKVATLSRLGLTQTELKSATKDVGNILDHFSAIQHIDTVGVPAADETGALANTAREDVVRSEQLATHADLLANAPATDKGQIKVPAVFTDVE